MLEQIIAVDERGEVAPLLELNILRKYPDFRGDHAADEADAIRYIPGETIEDLCRRSRLATGGYGAEHLEIRIIKR